MIDMVRFDHVTLSCKELICYSLMSSNAIQLRSVGLLVSASELRPVLLSGLNRRVVSLKKKLYSTLDC